MPGIKEVIEYYGKIVQLFEEQGFEDVIFFKGFSEKEEHNLNIVLKSRENLTAQMNDSLLIRKLHVSDQLLKLLSCKIIVDTYDDMMPMFIAKLNTSNSVKITPKLPREAFLSAFGLDWQFNLAAPYELTQVKNLPFYFKKSPSFNEGKQGIKLPDNININELEEKAAEGLVEKLASMQITTKPEFDNALKRIVEKTEQKWNEISEQKSKLTSKIG